MASHPVVGLHLVCTPGEAKCTPPKSEMHPIYGTLLKSSVIQTAPYEFLAYVVGWELLDRQRRDGVPNYYEYHYSTNYPANFNAYIKETYSKLEQERGILLNEMCEKNETK